MFNFLQFDKLRNNPLKYIGQVSISICVVASAIMNVRYAYSNNIDSYVLLPVFCAVALAFEGLKCTLLGKSINTFRKGTSFYVDGIFKLLMWCGLVMLSLYAALITVSDSVIGNPRLSDNVKVLESKVRELEPKVHASPQEITAKSVYERSKIKASVLKSTNNCQDVTVPKSREACMPLMELRVAYHKSEALVTLKEELKELQKRSSSIEISNGAKALSAILKVLGFKVSSEKLDLLRILALALLVEAITAIGFSLIDVPRRSKSKRLVKSDISDIHPKENINVNVNKEVNKLLNVSNEQQVAKIADDLTVIALARSLSNDEDVNKYKYKAA